MLIASPAHKDAYTKAGILHRDISVGNIIIKGQGWLIDWDMSKPVFSEDLETPRRATRTVRST
jgi:RIO-like serine/threonine protein kinase